MYVCTCEKQIVVVEKSSDSFMHLPANLIKIKWAHAFKEYECVLNFSLHIISDRK